MERRPSTDELIAAGFYDCPLCGTTHAEDMGNHLATHTEWTPEEIPLDG